MTMVSPGYSTSLGNPQAFNWASTGGTISNYNITSTASFKNNNGNSVLEIPSDGDSVILTGKLVINGEDIDERLKRIENMLHIPQRDVIMEQKYEKLKNLWQEYNETVKAIKTWETIKESQ
jgi:uncharacterized SAM-binding protein YcdF (DUF218 family)